MLKNILNLDGAQKLTSAEQKEINGGKLPTIICGGAPGAFIMSVSNCLCKNGGTFNMTTQKCSNGLSNHTYYIHETATNCCYTQGF
jgi:hypothetical protein